MTTIKKSDFVELDYTGRLVDEEVIFDTTNAEEAKKAGIHKPKMQYGPVIVCVGKRQLLAGLDESMEGKAVGKHDVELPPEKAFGKKSTDLLKMVPMRLFKKQNIRPMVGLSLNIDGMMGIVRSVSSGRVIMDFNHPMAGKTVQYSINILRKVDDLKEQISHFLALDLQTKPANIEVKVEGKKAVVTLPIKLPDPVKEALLKRTKEVWADITFEFKEKDSKAPKQASEADKKL